MPTKGSTVRFAVGSPDGAKSSTWRCWTPGKGKGDVYLSPRHMTGTYKLSLHESGAWQVGLTRYYKEKMIQEGRWLGGSRLQAEFSAPQQLGPGCNLAFRVWVAPSALTTEAGVQPMPPDVVWIPPPPPDKVAEIALLITTPDAQVTGWPGRRSMNTDLVGDFVLPSGDHIWLVHKLESLPTIPESRGSPTHFTPGPDFAQPLDDHVAVVLLNIDGQTSAFYECRVADQRFGRDVSA